jgi:lipopolysaccharide biosynthesis glycosyltransferase
MDKLEIHTLMCSADIDWLIKTVKLFTHHSELDFNLVVHEDGSFTKNDITKLSSSLDNTSVIGREYADEHIKEFLDNHELCTHFRFSEHHTIFRIKLFDPFFFTKSNNVMYMDSDILFCKKPHELIEYVNNKIGFYLLDMSSAYCVPFRDEDHDTSIYRKINAGLNYYPTKNHYNLDYVEECLSILYQHGSRGATHPFLEQNCIAYMITKLDQSGIQFNQLSNPEYCVPTFGEFIPEHNLTALHLNSSPIIGKWKAEHYQHELKKIYGNII